MSEEILKALMQLFAIITRQDEGVTDNEKESIRYFLQSQLNADQVEVYLSLYQSFYGEVITETQEEEAPKKKDVDLDKLLNHPLLSANPDELDDKDKQKLQRLKKKIRKEEAKRRELERSHANEESEATSVLDSVMTLSLCQKINHTLSQPQKIIVLVRLFELLKTDNKFTPQRMNIITTAAKVFNINDEEFKSIYGFVLNDLIFETDNVNLLVVDSLEDYNEFPCKFIKTENLHKNILILRVNSVGLYFMRYTGRKSELNFNGLLVDRNRVYLFPPGAIIRLPKDKPIYYSKVVAEFLSDETSSKISMEVDDLSFTFPNGNVGLHHVEISEEHGTLVGIMGASGAGKSTLLNVLCGIEKPSRGSVKINGIDIHNNPEEVEGVIGYIPQDDLLLEDLTVYQNLYYNAKLCFADKAEEELDELVMTTLHNLGLEPTKDLKVGNPLKKTISGGQRKRLNIGLELIRESSVLFVDEPTSGLSSRDSENVMDLLRELSLKGKVIFVVIHQPSSDIYKMFDKIFILDTGGYPIYNGNPVEAVSYFKKLDNQINAEEGECVKCGHVEVELIFNIIESQVIDEYGEYTGERKMTPKRWNRKFLENIKHEKVETQTEKPKGSLDRPNKIKQWIIFTTRDLLSKLSNRQYLAINLLEAPLLAIILAFTIRYVEGAEKTGYAFGKNENAPAYLFICIIVALFMGLTVSAEEIVKDRRIRKREAFLNLSNSSYFISKMGILFFISAVQTLSFVLIGNWILGISGMLWSTWLCLFTVSCFANMLGLNISATFNSAITIYILIPILLIPQMIFSGAMFNFDKLNEWLGSEDKVPIIADIMASRWAFEALAVDEFKSNHFEKQFYNYEKFESVADFKKVYYLPELQQRIEYCIRYVGVSDTNAISRVKNHLKDLEQQYTVLFKVQHEGINELSYNQLTKADLWKLERLVVNRYDIDSVATAKWIATIDSCKQYIKYDLNDRRLHVSNKLELLKNELQVQNVHSTMHFKDGPIYNGDVSLLNIENINLNSLFELNDYVSDIKDAYANLFKKAHEKLNILRFQLQETPDKKKQYKAAKAQFHNEELAGLVKKQSATKRIKNKDGHLIQLVDPIYRDPMKNKGFLDYRTHFFAPKKRMFNQNFETFSFNMAMIWVMSIILYITLFFGVFKALLEHLERLLGFISDNTIGPLSQWLKK